MRQREIMSVGLGHLFISRLSAADYIGIWQGTGVPEKNRNGVVWPSIPARALALRLSVPPYSQGYRRNRAPKEVQAPSLCPGQDVQEEQYRPDASQDGNVSAEKSKVAQIYLEKNG